MSTTERFHTNGITSFGGQANGTDLESSLFLCFSDRRTIAARIDSLVNLCPNSISDYVPLHEMCGSASRTISRAKQSKLVRPREILFIPRRLRVPERTKALPAVHRYGKWGPRFTTAAGSLYPSMLVAVVRRPYPRPRQLRAGQSSLGMPRTNLLGKGFGESVTHCWISDGPNRHHWVPHFAAPKLKRSTRSGAGYLQWVEYISRADQP